MKIDLDHLNDKQKEAVINIDGPCIVIAGAGSGKTRVITHRVAYLLSEGVSSRSILALTFTNKAAKEMKDRVVEIVGKSAEKLLIGTFHSIFLRLLRNFSEKLGYPKNFIVYDTLDSKSLVASIVKSMNLSSELYQPSTILSKISTLKNKIISAEDYDKDESNLNEDKNLGRPEFYRVYAAYSSKMKIAGAMDFDDLLFNFNRLISEFKDVLSIFQNNIEYILVDEFQDTNDIQFSIIDKLAKRHKNICVVGDDSQSIYGFRGAKLENILNFTKIYPDSKIIRLEQNYRSTKTIVGAANTVLGYNKNKIDKTIWTENLEGCPIRVIKAFNDIEESRLVGISIADIRSKNNLTNKDFAILYRTNTQSRQFEEVLRVLGIPYKIVGGISFYHRKEVKDLIAYFRVIINPKDDEAIKRIINAPKRGIGLVTVSKLETKANEMNTPIWDIMLMSKQMLGTASFRNLEEFYTMVDSLAYKWESKNPYDLAKEIVERSGLMKELYADKTVEGRSRYENVHELLSIVKRFSVDPKNANRNLSEFLQDISLLTDTENEDHDKLDAVTLMTIHSAKGLEFSHVFVVGVEEDLFPPSQSVHMPENLEEERRLFYVAMTRAKSGLSFSYSLQRYRFGRLKDCTMSRFLKEVPIEYFSEKDINKIDGRSYESYFNTNSVDSEDCKSNEFKTPSSISGNIEIVDDVSQLKIGTKVHHPRFGIGFITKTEGEGDSSKAIVNFTQSGEKKLLLKYAMLKVVFRK